MNDRSNTLVPIPSLELAEDELVKVLESSVYPGATHGSIQLVVAVCRAAHLDPLQKPFHIVPMDVKVKTPDGDKYEKRDVIMPGIGLYRIQAARTGQYAGKSLPEFGSMRKLTWSVEYEDEHRAQRTRDEEFEYPEWCEVTVYRIVGGVKCAFSAREYWLENYATTSRNSKVPNAMWRKRKMGQLAKCTEAQALRIGFPETGSQPTMEEMMGKVLDDTDGLIIEHESGQPAARSKVVMPQQQSKIEPTPPAGERAPIEGELVREEKKPQAGPPSKPDKPSGAVASAGLIKNIENKLRSLSKTPDGYEEVLKRALNNHNLSSLEAMTVDQAKGLQQWIRQQSPS
jgi:phage recombination protein Bet